MLPVSWTSRPKWWRFHVIWNITAEQWFGRVLDFWYPLYQSASLTNSKASVISGLPYDNRSTALRASCNSSLRHRLMQHCIIHILLTFYRNFPLTGIIARHIGIVISIALHLHPAVVHLLPYRLYCFQRMSHAWIRTAGNNPGSYANPREPFLKNSCINSASISLLLHPASRTLTIFWTPYWWCRTLPASDPVLLWFYRPLLRHDGRYCSYLIQRILSLPLNESWITGFNSNLRAIVLIKFR